MEPGTRCRVAGWGLFRNNKPSASDTLREVGVTVLDRKTCNSPKYYGHNPVIGLDMVCAGDRRGGKDSCDVSEGRPLTLAVGSRCAEIEKATSLSALATLGPLAALASAQGAGQQKGRVGCFVPG